VENGGNHLFSMPNQRKKGKMYVAAYVDEAKVRALRKQAANKGFSTSDMFKWLIDRQIASGE
jgi:hypothetical protein